MDKRSLACKIILVCSVVLKCKGWFGRTPFKWSLTLSPPGLQPLPLDQWSSVLVADSQPARHPHHCLLLCSAPARTMEPRTVEPCWGQVRQHQVTNTTKPLRLGKWDSGQVRLGDSVAASFPQWEQSAQEKCHWDNAVQLQLSCNLSK